MVRELSQGVRTEAMLPTGCGESVASLEVGRLWLQDPH